MDASVQSTSSTDHSITSVNVRHSSGKIEKVDGRIFVNASGAWASAVMKLFETAVKRSSSTGRIMQLPVTPRKRCIFNIRCPGQKLHPVPPATAPLVIDPTGVYFRPEGQNGRFIAGVSPNEDQDPDCCDADLDIVDHHLFEDTIWPALYNRVPAFEELKVVGSWAGFYDYNTLDQVYCFEFFYVPLNIFLFRMLLLAFIVTLRILYFAMAFLDMVCSSPQLLGVQLLSY